jgi:hypothetical protein
MAAHLTGDLPLLPLSHLLLRVWAEAQTIMIEVNGRVQIQMAGGKRGKEKGFLSAQFYTL